MVCVIRIYIINTAVSPRLVSLTPRYSLKCPIWWIKLSNEILAVRMFSQLKSTYFFWKFIIMGNVFIMIFGLLTTVKDFGKWCFGLLVTRIEADREWFKAEIRYFNHHLNKRYITTLVNTRYNFLCACIRSVSISVAHSEYKVGNIFSHVNFACRKDRCPFPYSISDLHATCPEDVLLSVQFLIS
jgi:hypothetical protein